MGSVEQVLMDPKHPYTKLLIESVPEADPKSAGAAGSRFLNWSTKNI